MMKRAILIIIPSLFFVGCEKPTEKIIEQGVHSISGKIQDTFVESYDNGKHSDSSKKTQLNIIKSHLDDLKKIGDPNIAEVYSLIDKHLEDDKLSNAENNEIISLIHKHKTAITMQKSKHSDDVTAFKDAIK